MARTNATNFTGPLQFPYATAAADIFKKEDVQTLALAVDGHDHTAGKGLSLAAGSIPNGTITSAMIADGAIVAADIADGAITSAKILDGTIATVDLADLSVTTPKLADASVSSSKMQPGTIVRANIATGGQITTAYASSYSLTASTTSTSPVIIPNTNLVFLTGGVQLIGWSLPIYTSTTCGVYVYLFVDSVAQMPLAYVNMTAALGTMNFGGVWLYTAASVGANHRFELGWAIGGAGTAILNGAAGALLTVADFAR